MRSFARLLLVPALMIGLAGLAAIPAEAQAPAQAPTTGTTKPATPAKSTPAQSTSAKKDQAIDINKASSADLDTLPGIGKKRAQKIIANRPYASPDELVTKKVIPKSVFDTIKPRLMASK